MQREALLLVVLDGMSYSEAAGVLGATNGWTLMSRLRPRPRRARTLATGAGEEAPRLRTVK